MTDKKKTNWVAWSYDTSPSDLAESILQEINFMLKIRKFILVLISIWNREILILKWN
jgi:hypothetical protein